MISLVELKGILKKIEFPFCMVYAIVYIYAGAQTQGWQSIDANKTCEKWKLSKIFF